VEGFLPIFFLGVVLKIPIFAGLYLIYWAVRAEPELDEVADDGDHGFRRWRTDPRKPRGPRRGPHSPDAMPLPDCPPGGRTRVVRRPAPARSSASR
jgi:hypothetical protein